MGFRLSCPEHLMVRGAKFVKNGMNGKINLAANQTASSAVHGIPLEAKCHGYTETGFRQVFELIEARQALNIKRTQKPGLTYAGPSR